MDKKKIIAIILFILLGLFIFTFANPAPSTLDPVEVPGQGEEDKDTDNEQDDNKDEEQDDEQEEDNNDRPVINVDEAPVIEINPKTVTILFGQNYDVMTGVKASDDNDVVSVTASITDTTKLEVGTHTITYTTSDKAGNTTTATRTIIVLNPTGDNDNDGYTNEEEIENGTNPDDEEEYPEYSKNPSIDFSSCATSMVVYDELINFEDCVKATDEFYGTEGVTIEVTNDVNPNQFGKYTITVVAKDNLNNETTENFEFEVLKRNVTVTINNVEAIYKDEVKPLTSNALEMAYNGNEIGVQLNTEVTNTTPAGKYAITGTWTNENYNVTFVDGVYSITSKTITEEDIKELGIEFNGATFIYDGTEKSLSVNNLPEEFNISYENNGKVDAGEYEVKAIITGNENYNGEITLTATMTISPKEIRLTWIDRGPFIYNGEKQVFKPQPVEGVEITVDVEGGNGIDVGKYTAVASTTNKNYTLTNNRQEYEIIAKTITKEDIKELGIEFNGATFIYDGTEKSLSVNNLPEGFNVSYENNDKVDVGEYEVKAIITGNENYNGEITLTATMTISPKEVRVYWIDRGTFIYNGEKQLPTAGAENGIEITVDVEEGNAIVVENYTALASTTKKNYTITNTTFEYELVAKEIKVTWIDRGDYTYDGKMHIPTAIVENGIDYTVKVKDGNAIDAGNYTAIVVTSDGNYVLVGATKDYKILKATPSYTIPSNLEANEGETLGDVELPEGFTFEESTTKVLTEGEYKTTVIYTPEDTKNYNVVEGIEVTIKVKPVYFIIKFLDKDNQIISTQEIKKGESAKEPNITKEYEANGKIYIFNGWAGNYKNVTADATIKPIYLEQEASGTYAYILKPQYVRPVDGEGYPTDYYYNALEDEEGNKVSLTINVSGLTEEQANDIKNGVDPVIIGLGEEEVFKYLAQSTKDALNEISHGVDEGGAYTIEWYVLKYQADGWHLDGHKVYDKTIVNVGKKGLNISVNFNNAVTNLKVEADGKKIDMYNPTLNNKIGNTWISVLPIFSDTVKVTYTVNGIEYTETFDI